MGLTWIVGVLIVELEELLFLAYIYTIMVAFQGFWIFLIFVVASKKVRDAFLKWWRTKVNESSILSRMFGHSINSSLGNGTVSLLIFNTHVQVMSAA